MDISILASPGKKEGRNAVDAYVEELAQLRDEGFTRAWSTQLPWETDLLTVLAVALREVDTIEVGTGVMPIQIQHPMLLAQRALTVNLIAGGRLLLGIGMSHRTVTENMWGMPWDKSVRRLNEYLDGLLPLLAGDTVEAAGETVTTRGRVKVRGASAPPVYIAALGPKLLAVAGARSAGTLTWMTGPRTLRDHIAPALRAAVSEAGRAAGSAKVAAVLPVSVTDDVDTARAQAAEQFGMYGHMPSYRAMLDREGFAEPADAALIGDEMVVSQRLDELRDAGVDEFVAAVYDPSPEGRARTRALMQQWVS